jgi:hypothetical protein
MVRMKERAVAATTIQARQRGAVRRRWYVERTLLLLLLPVLLLLLLGCATAGLRYCCSLARRDSAPADMLPLLPHYYRCRRYY